jgi:hypothetical protein
MELSSHYREWVVVLEAAGDPDSTLLDLGTTAANVRILVINSTDTWGELAWST